MFFSWDLKKHTVFTEMHLPNHSWGWKLHLHLFSIGDLQGSHQGSHQCVLGCAVSGWCWWLLHTSVFAQQLQIAQPPAGIPWAGTKMFSAMVASLQVWVLGNVRLRSPSVPERHLLPAEVPPSPAALLRHEPLAETTPVAVAWLCFGYSGIGGVQVMQEETGGWQTLYSHWFPALVNIHWRKCDRLESH